MHKLLSVIIPLLVFIHTCNGKEKRNMFTAAVFENVPAHDSSMSPAEILNANRKVVETAAEEAAKRKVDILVFSEYVLFPPGARKITKNAAVNVPDPRRTPVNPCDKNPPSEENPDALSIFSCIAKKHKIYVVANILDIHPCKEETLQCDANNVEGCKTIEKCPKDENLMYNTDIAFDREGNLIARYHKNHLYFELLETPTEPDMITFETEFGIFGMIVCFDSVFEDAVSLVKKHNVDTLIFPTHWFDDIVPFNGAEWQQSWALGNRVNFLAANKHVPGNGTLGSGIYSKKHGALAYTYNPDGKSKLVISQLSNDGSKPKAAGKVLTIDENGVHETSEQGDSFPDQCFVEVVGYPKDMSKDYRCYKQQTKNHVIEKLEKSKSKIEVCDKEFCCSLRYEADAMAEDYYLTAFQGQNDVFDYFRWEEQTCLLVRCDPFENKPCVTIPSRAKTSFKFIELRAKFKKQSVVYPTVSKSQNRLAPKSEWTLESQKDTSTLKFNSKSKEPILKVGLFARNYAEDPKFVPFEGEKSFF